MYSSLKKLTFVIFVICLLSGMAQTALAADTFRTTDSVFFRKDASTDAEAYRLLDPGTNVEVLEHDPAGWSKVTQNGNTGYIRSDFLKYHIGSGSSASFKVKATDGVNLRERASTDSKVLTSIIDGAIVDVFEHDPAGWSKVRFDGINGFIRSDFLMRFAQQVQTPETPVETPGNVPDTPAETVPVEPPVILYKTIALVNFRTGPSKDHSVIRTVKSGSDVEVIEHGFDGWSFVRIRGIEGYIDSTLIQGPAKVNKAELLDWSAAKDLIKTGVPYQIIDVRTGLSYTMQVFAKNTHADIEPLTALDTSTILTSRNGVWAWDPRPVWITIGDRVIAAALNGMPHDVSTIRNNNMNGHLCLHFNNTVANNRSYQRDLNNAVIEAYNAGRQD